jgi:hypothetical protein
MKLSKKEIKYLSASFKPKSPLSIFDNILDETDGSEYQSLVDKGIIVGQSYEPKALEMLLLLTSSEKCGRYLVQTPFFIIEKYTYRTGDKLILAENYEGDLQFSYLDDITELSIKLSEIYGMSKIVNTDLEGVYNPDEMMTMLAMVDLVRKNYLCKYADMKQTKEVFTVQEIQQEIESDYKNGLAQVFISNYNPTLPDKEKIQAALDSLIAKDALKSEGDYSLKGEYDRLAKNFLIIESITLYEALDVQPDGVIAAAAKLAVTSGLRDIIAMTFDGEMAEFSTVSAGQLLGNIENFMSCPEFLQKPSEQPPVAAPATPPPPPPVTAPATPPPPPPVTAPATPPPPAAAAPVAPATASPSTAYRAPATSPVASVPVQTVPAGWLCTSCQRRNTGNFCAGCGRRKP